MLVFEVIGDIELPEALKGYGDVLGGSSKFLNNIFTLLTVGGGIFTLFNFIRAGYIYMGAKNDKEKIEEAGGLMTNSIVGLFIIAAAFVIAALIGKIFFGSWTFIISPTISGPGIGKG